MPARSKTLALGSMLMTALWLTPPALALEEHEKKEMGAFIREYLLENPEVMLEVQSALEAKQHAQRLERSPRTATRSSTPSMTLRSAIPMATSRWSSSLTTTVATASGRWPTWRRSSQAIRTSASS